MSCTIWEEPEWMNLSAHAKTLLLLKVTHPTAESFSDDLQAAMAGLPRKWTRQDNAEPSYEDAIEELVGNELIEEHGFVQAKEWWLGLLGLGPVAPPPAPTPAAAPAPAPVKAPAPAKSPAPAGEQPQLSLVKTAGGAP